MTWIVCECQKQHRTGVNVNELERISYIIPLRLGAFKFLSSALMAVAAPDPKHHGEMAVDASTFSHEFGGP